MNFTALLVKGNSGHLSLSLSLSLSHSLTLPTRSRLGFHRCAAPKSLKRIRMTSPMHIHALSFPFLSVDLPASWLPILEIITLSSGARDSARQRDRNAR